MILTGEKTEILGLNSVPVPLCPPQILLYPDVYFKDPVRTAQ
jgi:hypothetical protein